MSILTTEKQSQGSVLRIHGSGEVFVEDVYRYLNALEYAYNSAYVLDSIIGQAEELSKLYKRLPIPLKNILWGNWWPPNTEKIASLVPDENRLKLCSVQLKSSYFWDFMGKLNPLKVLQAYLSAQCKQKNGREYREKKEIGKLELENELLETNPIGKKLELLKQMGVTSQDLSLLKDRLLRRPLRGLNKYQDQVMIASAEIVLLRDRKKLVPPAVPIIPPVLQEDKDLFELEQLKERRQREKRHSEVKTREELIKKFIAEASKKAEDNKMRIKKIRREKNVALANFVTWHRGTGLLKDDG